MFDLLLVLAVCIGPFIPMGLVVAHLERKRSPRLNWTRDFK